MLLLFILLLTGWRTK